jgi:hypothetical protein
MGSEASTWEAPKAPAHSADWTTGVCVWVQASGGWSAEMGEGGMPETRVTDDGNLGNELKISYLISNI